MAVQLLQILADGRFHSGEELGRILGISRSAVAKRLQQLESSHGLQLQAVRGKGYRLDEALSLLDVARLQEALSDLRIVVEASIGSTNARAMQLASDMGSAPLLILAETQTAGRGRRGRGWCSPFAANLYLTRLLRIEQPATQLQAPSLVVGLAVVNALRELGLSDCGLKWPNDVLAGGRKLGGILLELTGDPADVCHVVIGIGLNVNMLDADIDQAWTSLRKELGYRIDRTELSIRVIRALESVLSRHREGGFSRLKAEWEALHLWQDRAVRLTGPQGYIDGHVLGVTADGSLRLLVEGYEQVFSGGELSLRLRDDS